MLKEVARFLGDFSSIELFISIMLAILFTFISTICYSYTNVISSEKAVVYFGFPSPVMKIEYRQELEDIYFRWGVLNALVVKGQTELLFEGAFLDILFYTLVSFFLVRTIYYIRDEYGYRRYYGSRA